jgi:Leucine-rich repeat (LRR) protein
MLINLRISNNKLVAIDLSANKELKHLDLAGNQLNEI